jgi:hypothetical protein
MEHPARILQTEDLKDQRQIIVSSAIELIGRTEQNGFAHERLNASFPQISLPVALVIKMAHLDVQDNAFMVVVTDKSNNQQFNDIIVRTQLISDIPLSYYRYKQIAGTEVEDPSKQRLIHVLEVAHAAFEKDKFILCCMTLVNELAHRFHCSQVSLGWRKGHYVRTVAISHLEDFKKHGSAVTALNDVYEEAYEQNDIIAYPKMDEHFVITKVHEAYSRKFGLQQIVSVPIRMHGDIMGIITLEKQESELSRTDVDAVQLIADQVATWLETLHYQDRWIGGRIALKAKRTLDSLLGVEHSLIKAVVSVAFGDIPFCFVRYLGLQGRRKRNAGNGFGQLYIVAL